MTNLVPARNKLTGKTQNVRPEAVDVPGGFFESIAPAPKPPKSSAPKRAVTVESKETNPPVLGDESKE